MVFAIGIEDPLAVPIDDLQRSRPGKEHRVVLLRRPGERVRRCKHARMVVLCLGTVLARYSTASRSVVSVMPSSSTIGSSKRFDRPLFAIRFKILSAVAGVRRSCCSEGRACRPRHRCRRAVPAMADRDALHRPIRRRRIASRCVPAWRVPRVQVPTALRQAHISTGFARCQCRQ
jgi:hypothetical protein